MDIAGVFRTVNILNDPFVITIPPTEKIVENTEEILPENSGDSTIFITTIFFIIIILGLIFYFIKKSGFFTRNEEEDVSSIFSGSCQEEQSFMGRITRRRTEERNPLYERRSVRSLWPERIFDSGDE